MESRTRRVKTRFLILSDTHITSDEHAEGLSNFLPERRVDVAIHCGDLTHESKLTEFKAAIRLLEEINAPLKLVVAGNHDFTLDTPAYHRIVSKSDRSDLCGGDLDTIKKTFGDFGEARHLMEQARSSGIIYLTEGNHSFNLANGAQMRVYASPYTPSKHPWGFQFDPNTQHGFAMDRPDVVITHGPPHGILDFTKSGQEAGSRSLLVSLSRARPLLHCFGHIHESWGACLRHWDTGEDFNLGVVRMGMKKADGTVREWACGTSHCSGDVRPLVPGMETLFVNAAIQRTPEEPFNVPWIIDIELPRV